MRFTVTKFRAGPNLPARNALLTSQMSEFRPQSGFLHNRMRNGDKLNAWLGAVHGALAISPMYAAVSPFFMDGTEQTYTTTPDTGETTSASLLPK